MTEGRILHGRTPGLWTIVLLALFLAAESALPEPPKGFSWEKCKEIDAALLRPDSWFFKHESAEETHAYYITKESIEAGASFETGLSLNVVVDIPKRAGVTPSEYAKKYLKETAQRTREEKAWEEQRGELNTFHALVVEKEGKDPLRMHFALIANDKTGKLYVFLYESPVRLWETNGPVGEIILKNIRVDSSR